MKCSQCGASRTPGALFCDVCGAPQAPATRERTRSGPFQVGEPVTLSAAPSPDGAFAEASSVSLLAVLSLVVGAMSAFTLLFFGIIFLVIGPIVGLPPALAGIALGHVSLARIRASKGRLTGEAAAIFGLVFSYLTLLIALPVTLFWLLIGKWAFG